ncbi:MAG TPA: (2Fe-2S)-binding protein [bacterium]|nr:(2Fe-2S)-binding protein [bacterium]
MSPARHIELLVNGERVSIEVEDNWTLLRLLRDELALTGTKEGCGRGECGACTVIMDGRPVNACLVLAREAEGREILTIEGEGRRAGEGRSGLQQAFIDHGAFQCGFCTAGMIMSARALLMGNPDPTEAEVKEAISGNLCRCTGYLPIIEAILDAAYRERNGGERVET